MRKEELLQGLNNLQYSDEDVAEYSVETKMNKGNIKRTKMVVMKRVLMQRCYERVQDELQEYEEILYSMFTLNTRVKEMEAGVAFGSGVGALAMNFGIHSVLVVTSEKIYVFFVDRYYNDVDLKIYQFEEIVSMKTVLDRKGGSEFLYVKFTNGKEYVLLGIDEEYRELFQVLRKVKQASGIVLSVQDKKLTWSLRRKRMVFYVVMYSFVIYFFYKAYVNFMPH
ncbi:septation ring formation regulator EzrA [Bacillus sp. C1]